MCFWCVNKKEALSTFSHTAVIMTEHLHAACFWKHWIRKTVSIWRLLVMQVCCRLHLSTRGSESVTESGKDGVRLSLFLERQRGSFTSFHSQTKVSIRFPFFLLVPICPPSALLACVCFLENIRTRLAAHRQHRRKVHQPAARSFQWICFVLVRLKFRPGCADMYTKLYILTCCLPAPNPHNNQ